MSTLEARFWAKVDRWDPDECWEWTASHTHDGYSRLHYPTWRDNGYAHRFAYELLVGPIPVGLRIDHLCRNRGCVNPKHMEPVTHRENLMRGIGPAARNAHANACKHGHPFTEANTYHPPKRPTARSCRACASRRDQELKARRRSA